MGRGKRSTALEHLWRPGRSEVVAVVALTRYARMAWDLRERLVIGGMGG